MLTREENEFLTQVSRGTPCGELLRRYWHPVAAAGEFTEEKPIRPVKILGEELVVYRDKKGNYGLVGEHCPHRSASLAYGRVDDEGIRCPYHGWKFDCTGKCLEQPAEPADSTFKDRIKHVAYPVEYLGGLIYAYLGPAPVPLLPRWDVLVWEHGKRWIVKESIIDCNWLQPMENSVDPSHLYWLHGDTAHLAPRVKKYAEKHEFIRFEYGIKKRRTTLPLATGAEPAVDEHPLLFPSVLRHVAPFNEGNGHRHNLTDPRAGGRLSHAGFSRKFRAVRDRTLARRRAGAVSFHAAQNRTARVQDEHGVGAGLDGVGNSRCCSPTAPENTSASATKGVIELRKLLREQIERVQQGLEPLGIIRDPERNQLIDLGVINERIGLFAASDARATQSRAAR